VRSKEANVTFKTMYILFLCHFTHTVMLLAQLIA